jgi:hypothetical protein
MIGPLQPDPGEDFWVEPAGRQAIAEGAFPFRGLLQVKATAKAEDSTFSDDIPVKQIVRWASQPLPVFLVGVRTPPPPAFYAKSIDQIVAEDLKGQDPTTLRTQTARVWLPLVTDLAAMLTEAIHEHHRSLQLVLEGVSETDIEQHYFEVLERKRPERWEKVPIASWRVLWKSAPRPQQFAAMLTELARRAQPRVRVPQTPAGLRDLPRLPLALRRPAQSRRGQGGLGRPDAAPGRPHQGDPWGRGRFQCPPRP